MTVKLASVRRDDSNDRDGIWNDSAAVPGVSFKVRPISYEPYTTARDLMMQRLARQYGGKPVPQKVRLAELGKLYAEHLLVDWKGFDEPYSRAVADEMLGDALCADLILAVEQSATLVSQAAIEFLDDAAKNSARPSDTP